MARSGGTDVSFNEEFFATILHSPAVERLCDTAGQSALATAKANAPVDTGEYRDGLHIEHRDAKYRRVTRVVGSDPKTMIIEAKTGNLARALKAAKS